MCCIDACIKAKYVMSVKMYRDKVLKERLLKWKETITWFKFVTMMVKDQHRIFNLKRIISEWKEMYMYNVEQRRIDNEIKWNKAIKSDNKRLMENSIIQWKRYIIICKKEKIKANAWKKIDKWLSEIRD